MTLTKSWNKLLRFDTNEQSPSTVEPAESDSTNAEVMELAHQLDSNLEDEDVHDWLKFDSIDKGHQLLSDDDIVKQIIQMDETT